jgi:hypothetical protein
VIATLFPPSHAERASGSRSTKEHGLRGRRLVEVVGAREVLFLLEKKVEKVGCTCRAGKCYCSST